MGVLRLVGDSFWFRLGCLSAGLAVATGAFGAHGLQRRIADPKLLKTWDTAAHYQMIHSIALCLTPFCARPGLAGTLFSAGIALFSGSLYALVLTGERRLGAITPIGGLAFIAGWIGMSGVL